MDPRLLLATDGNNDNLHYGDAIAAPDKKEFLQAKKKEINDLTKDKVWRLELKKNVPPRRQNSYAWSGVLKGNKIHLESYSNIRLVFVSMVVCKQKESTIGIHMLQ